MPNLVGYSGIPHQARGKHLSLLFAWHRLDTNTVLSKKCRKMEETFKHRRRIFVIIFVLYLQGVSLEHMNQDKDGNFVQLLVKLGWWLWVCNLFVAWMSHIHICLSIKVSIEYALLLGLLSPSLKLASHTIITDTCWLWTPADATCDGSSLNSGWQSFELC